MISLPLVTRYFWVTAISAVISTSAMAESPSGLLSEFYETLEQDVYDRDAVAKFFADDYVDHTRPAGFPDEMSDKAVIMMILDNLESGMPDGSRLVAFSQDLDAERALAHFTFTGTHTGNFYDMSASQNAVIFRGFDVYRVRAGQFVEHWHVEEVKNLLDAIAEK